MFYLQTFSQKKARLGVIPANGTALYGWVILQYYREQTISSATIISIKEFLQFRNIVIVIISPIL